MHEATVPVFDLQQMELSVTACVAPIRGQLWDHLWSNLCAATTQVLTASVPKVKV